MQLVNATGLIETVTSIISTGRGLCCDTSYVVHATKQLDSLPQVEQRQQEQFLQFMAPHHAAPHPSFLRSEGDTQVYREGKQ